MKAFVSWSGGKESTLSCYKTMDKLEVTCLLNMISEDGKRSRSHGLDSMLLKAQSKAIEIPIIQRKTTWQNYEQEFKKAVSELKKQGVEAGVFGDIDLEEHREWVERVCRELGIKAILPLWGKPRTEVVSEFIDSGFEAVVVATKAELLGAEWLGRRIDQRFVSDIRHLAGVDLCGESGEYHTFVTDGPIFKRKIKITAAEKEKIDEHWFWNILKFIVE
ncbi:diphthine--ammonia ligase [candidate division KSB1 bacterium]|nr:MAG: diphthine--ammonia ligase [candidate division KSB1 bacterium]